MDQSNAAWIAANGEPFRGLAHARNNLGMLLARTGREQEAMHQFAKAGCDRAQATANLALAMALEGRVESAQEAYQQTLRQNPNLAGARQMLANLESISSDRPAHYETTMVPHATNAMLPASYHQPVGNSSNEALSEMGADPLEGTVRRGSLTPPEPPTNRVLIRS